MSSHQHSHQVPQASSALSQWATMAVIATLTAVAMIIFAAAARAQQIPVPTTGPDAVDTVTEAENVPRDAETAPAQTQPLPPPSEAEGTTAAAMTAPRARIDFRRFGVRFEQARQADVQSTPAEQAQPAALTVAKVRQPSVASKMGLQPGDQIVSIAGEQVQSEAALNQALEQALRSGPREEHVDIPMTVQRDGGRRILALSNDEITAAGYGPLLVEYGHYVPPQYVTGYRGSLEDPDIPANPKGAYLGVELDRQYRQAAIVSRVLPGTPAAQAGLKPGDRIFAINNQRVDSPNQLIYWIGQLQPGDAIEISFDRAHDLEITLGSRQGVKPAASASESGHSQSPPQPSE